MNYNLDACALIALLDNEEGADIVQGIISKAIDGEISMYMSVINYTEIYYDRLKIGGLEKAQIFADNLSYLPITIVENISRAVSHNAARLKIAHHISLADSVPISITAQSALRFPTFYAILST